MNIRNVKIYQTAVRITAKEFNIPEVVVWQVLEAMFRKLRDVVLKWDTYLIKDTLDVYFPVLGRLEMTVKKNMFRDVIEENKLRLASTTVKRTATVDNPVKIGGRQFNFQGRVTTSKVNPYKDNNEDLG